MNSVKKFTAFGVLAVLGYAGTALAAGSWSYSGHGGPEEWGGMNPDFATCKIGKNQSPIDIRDAKSGDLAAIKFDYKPSPLKVIDNGHTVQVNYASGSSIEVDGKRYDLLQFHFHKPSEEKVDGKPYPMVAHLVHKNAEGKLAVVGVLLDKGGSNAVISTVWKNLPKEKEKEVNAAGVTIDIANLLPQNKGYYKFTGSLTTPPCSEEVTWLVLKTPVKIADADVDAFGKVYPMNARPTQPLNGRVIQASK